MPHEPLNSRLPQIFHRLDVTGLEERYLGVLDDGIARTHAKAVSLQDLRSIDRIPDRFLPFLGMLVGHVWRSERGYAWNRLRIRNAIRRYSYKGTLEKLGDSVLENGGGEWSVTDNESRLIIWDRQGSWDTDNCHWPSADYWHDGAFVLRVPRSLDYEGLMADLAETLAAGEVWYFEVADQKGIDYIAEWSHQHIESRPSTNALEYVLDHGRWDVDLYYDFDPSEIPAKSFWPIVWHHQGSEMGSRWDATGAWDVDLYYDFDPATMPQRCTRIRDLAIAGAYLTAGDTINVGSTDFDMGDGTPAQPLSEAQAVIQRGTQKTFIEV